MNFTVDYDDEEQQHPYAEEVQEFNDLLYFHAPDVHANDDNFEGTAAKHLSGGLMSEEVVEPAEVVSSELPREDPPSLVEPMPKQGPPSLLEEDSTPAGTYTSSGIASIKDLARRRGGWFEGHVIPAAALLAASKAEEGTAGAPGVPEEPAIPVPELGPVMEDELPPPVSMPDLELLNPEEPKEGSEDTVIWRAFVDLKRLSSEGASELLSCYEKVRSLQFDHEEKAATYREATEKLIQDQRQRVAELTSECRYLRTTNQRIQLVVEQVSQQLRKCEKAKYELSRRLHEVEQKHELASNRVVIAENGYKILDQRCKELEAALDHSNEIITMLRKSLREANLDKEAALQEQHRKYENNRRDIIAFYDEREKRMLEEFNGTVTKLQDIMTAAMKQREEQLCDCWKEMMRAQEGKHAEIVKELCLLREREERDFKMRTAAVEQESQRLSEQYRSEMMLLEQRHGEREQQILGDLVRRERALDEREQRLRAQQSQNEQDLKVALLANEAEYKARYERAIEDIRESFGKEREEMLSFFRSQVQELSQLHRENERELERMHREKEREMAQRYRIAGYEMDDRKSDMDLRSVTMATQSAFLSKLDAVEARQRERAEKVRAVFKAPTEGKPTQ